MLIFFNNWPSIQDQERGEECWVHSPFRQKEKTLRSKSGDSSSHHHPMVHLCHWLRFVRPQLVGLAASRNWDVEGDFGSGTKRSQSTENFLDPKTIFMLIVQFLPESRFVLGWTNLTVWYWKLYTFLQLCRSDVTARWLLDYSYVPI